MLKFSNLRLTLNKGLAVSIAALTLLSVNNILKYNFLIVLYKSQLYQFRFFKKDIYLFKLVLQN